MLSLQIGDTIRRLRREKNVTQEQLAEVLHISTQAVSKWERNETYPDITMLLPLASFFGVTTDELLGVDAAKTEEEIQKYLKMHWDAVKQNTYNEAGKIIREAYTSYPNDFRILCQYMWDLAGGNTDNDPILIEHHEELDTLSRRILEECTDDRIRRGAMDMQAKLCKVRGDIEGAMTILNRFPTWYGETRGQKAEQLYAKKTDGWWYWLHRNIFDLTEFAADKIGKAIWYSEKSFAEKMAAVRMMASELEKLVDLTDWKPGYRHIALVYSTAANRALQEDEYDIAVENFRLYLLWANRFDQYRSSGEPFATMPPAVLQDMMEGWADADGMVKRILPLLETSSLYAPLREREDFRSLLEQYR
ncbi:MAG: helix-turn-helix transcriptional regulator [Clostridia bacterium]|nr:helix-turn-helix transcriptional regulator [Clostridia bacterium]